VKLETPAEKGFLQSLDDFWFGRGSPTAMGLFRIFVGLLAFVNLAMISLDWDAWYSERGYIPAWLGRMFGGWSAKIGPGGHLSIPRVDVLANVTDPRVAVAIYALIMLAAFMTMLGYWTRFSSICLAVGIVSLHQRNQLILHGGDSVLRLMCLYVAIAPSGRACSIDRLIRLWKGLEVGPPPKVSMWPQRLVMYNLSLIYLTTMWLKWYGSLWKGGTATWYPARLPEFFRFPVPEFVNSLPFVKFTTYATLLTEFMLGTLIFYKPARKYVLAAGIMMHGWIDYSMNIPLFGFMMVAMYITCYEGEEVELWAKRMGARLKKFATTILLPETDELTPHGEAFLNAVDPLDLVTYTHGEVEAIDSSAVRRSWTHSVGAWPFGWIPGVWQRLFLASIAKTEQ
jgi:hypothetical protein